MRVPSRRHVENGVSTRGCAPGLVADRRRGTFVCSQLYARDTGYCMQAGSKVTTSMGVPLPENR
jgi:hypothetical protein